MKEQKIDKFRPRFFIDKEGNWSQDGITVSHRWTYLHNNKLLRQDEEGRYYVDEGSGRLYVEVEDTPFVVKMIYKREDGFYVSLNDETEEKLDLDKLWMNQDNIAYTRVKNDKYQARLLRPAYYELTKYVYQEGDDFYIEVNGIKHKVRPKS